MIIQIRLEPDETEGTHTGYYNYEFGRTETDSVDDELDYIVHFSGGERGTLSQRNRNNYSVHNSEVTIITDVED